jgi:hypothetical protein
MVVFSLTVIVLLMIEAQNTHEIFRIEYNNTLVPSEQQRIIFKNITLSQFLH